ncbi:MAG: rod-determining factor RdfA, partial [Halobacteriaceae archaeon]
MTGCSCVISRRADEYEIVTPENSLDAHLRDRWLGTGDADPVGYRPLTRWFNTQILHATYWRAGYYVSPHREETDLDVLTGDASPATTALTTDLRAEGIDVDRLEGAFISRESMYRHLRTCLGL